MYKPTGSKEIIERLQHIRALLRQLRPTSDLQRIRTEVREQRLKDLITNLRRTNGRAMVQMLDEVEAECLLTKDGGYRLFGYDLDSIREYDLALNGGRTHIIESYIFERDLPVELPLELAPEEAFRRTALLSDLVRGWQGGIPIRALDRRLWRQPGAFYVHVGTEDSLGSSLPPGTTALVEPLGEEEVRQPNPRSTYCLQFRNGYRFSRCLVTKGKLLLLSTDRSYSGTEAFVYPREVRIAGRVRAIAVALPSQDFLSLRGIWTYPGTAALILPWEHRSRWSLLATKHKRFVRPQAELVQVQQFLQNILKSNLSERTRRRYRSDTDSEPHADALIQLSLEHYARYSDLLRLGRHGLRDQGRFSLEAMLNANRFSELLGMRTYPSVPAPPEVWDARRKELGEYGALFAQHFPKPSQWGSRVIRISNDVLLRGTSQQIRAGSWIALANLPEVLDAESEGSKRGWARPLYALSRGLETFFGHIERDGNALALMVHRASSWEPVKISLEELPFLQRACGAVIPF